MNETIPIDEIIEEFAEDEEAIFTDSDGKKSKIKFILNYGNINVPIGDSSRAETRKFATCRTADVEDVDNKCRFEIKINNESINYYIINVIHDGLGLTHLELSKESI